MDIRTRKVKGWSVTAVAARYGVHPETVRVWIRQGRLKANRGPHGRYVVPGHALSRFRPAGSSSTQFKPGERTLAPTIDTTSRERPTLTSECADCEHDWQVAQSGHQTGGAGRHHVSWHGLFRVRCPRCGCYSWLDNQMRVSDIHSDQVETRRYNKRIRERSEWGLKE